MADDDVVDDRHSMLKHFFMAMGEDLTCSCTPNSLTPPPPPPPPTPFSKTVVLPCPLQVLELWPLFPQLEHFLAMDGTARYTTANDKKAS
jgi:hypothetical protein